MALQTRWARPILPRAMAAQPLPSPPEAAPGATAFSYRPEEEAELAARLDRLVAMVSDRFPDSDTGMLHRAFVTAALAHGDQRRKSGEPYISHPLAVAEIMADLGLDAPAAAAALLHDVVEDTAVDQVTVDADFGPEVGRLVAGVTKISAIEAREKTAAEAESLRRMLLASVDDLRVILIKMADRLHNMQTLGALSPERRRVMALETLEIYAPLANRLGIWQFKSQFEDLALKELDPDSFEAIERALAERRAAHEDYLAGVIAILDGRLRETGLQAEIQARAKHIYSIHRKMQRKDVPAEQIYDALAVRMLVETTAQCYVALGVVHTLWPPMPGQFDDYIAKKKDNLYQSLHTSVWGPGNRPLEVQIRTHEMHRVAEHGVAAHWLYKEDNRRAREIEERVAALRRILESHDEDAVDAQAFIEGLKTDVFRDQVYVFTPNGAVIELPTGATPVDFAYHVHTEIGHRCRGAMVNGKMVALDTPLSTGQTVKIITAKGEAGPSRDWLNPNLGYVSSNRARNMIKQWFRRQQKGQSVQEGREILERQLRRLGMTKLSHDAAAKLFGYERLDDFYAAIGHNDVPMEVLGTRLLEHEAGHLDERAARPARPAPPATPARKDAGPAAGVTVRGADGLFTRVASCCHPLPGDEVVGYVTRGQGVTLHQSDCRNIVALREREPERFIRVNWQQNETRSYPVELRIVAYDRPGLVRDVSDVMARRGVNMSSVTATVHNSDGAAMVTAVVEMSSMTQLATLIDRLEMIENVIEVHRAHG
jgi:GTP diphosphokinase / guanosine-3',5'-bis(diphosphate) 3'-diphosphatase